MLDTGCEQPKIRDTTENKPDTATQEHVLVIPSPPPARAAKQDLYLRSPHRNLLPYCFDHAKRPGYTTKISQPPPHRPPNPHRNPHPPFHHARILPLLPELPPLRRSSYYRATLYCSIHRSADVRCGALVAQKRRYQEREEKVCEGTGNAVGVGGSHVGEHAGEGGGEDVAQHLG
jgi:hypothetical protein